MKKRASRRPPPKKKTSSTAIARREDVAKIEVADPDGLLAPVVGELGELAHTGGIGLAEVKLTKAEERIVARAVNRAEIMVHPKGFIYLPHPVYTRWLNEAFGRTGWAIVPVAKPMKIENLIIVPHVLYVHRIPVAFAHGGAEYSEKNKQQTYDDVLESTTAFALRRCCKRFGMALELWEKPYVREFLASAAIQVDTDKGKMWRLKTDPPLPGEVVRRRAAREAPVVDAELVTGSDGSGAEPISSEQARRMVNIWRKAGRADAEVQLWLKKVHGYSATADIRRKDYQRICNQLEARGELSLPGDR